jgi:hypothetical protein
LPGRQSFAELFILAWQGAVAGIKKHQLLSGVHKRWDVRMFEPLSIDIVGTGKRMHFVRRGICAVVWVQSIADRLGIEDGSDLKFPELETIDCRL